MKDGEFGLTLKPRDEKTTMPRWIYQAEFSKKHGSFFSRRTSDGKKYEKITAEHYFEVMERVAKKEKEKEKQERKRATLITA